jgi:hypothetical protein
MPDPTFVTLSTGLHAKHSSFREAIQNERVVAWAYARSMRPIVGSFFFAAHAGIYYLIRFTELSVTNISLLLVLYSLLSTFTTTRAALHWLNSLDNST